MGYRILVVDDSEIIRGVVRKSVNMSGLAVDVIFEAGNGVEALKTLESEWIDIVFADLNMPEMNGMELVQKMSADNLLESIPVVVVSSEHSQARINELMEQGIKAYIKKPFRPENFRDVVLEVLGDLTGEA